MKKSVYVVTAYRWGDRNLHSYVVGVFDKKHKAINSADEQSAFRGGKYGCVVEEFIMGEYSDIPQHKEIYMSKYTGSK